MTATDRKVFENKILNAKTQNELIKIQKEFHKLKVEILMIEILQDNGYDINHYLGTESHIYGPDCQFNGKAAEIKTSFSGWSHLDLLEKGFNPFEIFKINLQQLKNYVAEKKANMPILFLLSNYGGGPTNDLFQQMYSRSDFYDPELNLNQKQLILCIQTPKQLYEILNQQNPAAYIQNIKQKQRQTITKQSEIVVFGSHNTKRLELTRLQEKKLMNLSFLNSLIEKKHLQFRKDNLIKIKK